MKFVSSLICAVVAASAGSAIADCGGGWYYYGGCPNWSYQCPGFPMDCDPLGPVAAPARAQASLPAVNAPAGVSSERERAELERVEEERRELERSALRSSDLKPGNLEPGNLEPGNLEPGDLEPGDLPPAEDLTPAGVGDRISQPTATIRRRSAVPFIV